MRSGGWFHSLGCFFSKRKGEMERRGGERPQFSGILTAFFASFPSFSASEEVMANHFIRAKSSHAESTSGEGSWR